MWCKCIVVTFKCIDQTISERGRVAQSALKWLSSSASMHYQVDQYHYSALIIQSVKEHQWSENKGRSSAIEIWSTGHLCHKQFFVFIVALHQQWLMLKTVKVVFCTPLYCITLYPVLDTSSNLCHMSHFSLVPPPARNPVHAPKYWQTYPRKHQKYPCKHQKP